MRFCKLLPFILLLLTSCRTIKRNVAKVDSSSVKSENTNAKFNREVITEYVLDTIWKTRTLEVPDVRIVEVPKPYVIRQTVRESGEVQQTKQEAVEVAKTEKNVEAGIPLMIQFSAVVLSVSLLLAVVAVLIKLTK